MTLWAWIVRLWARPVPVDPPDPSKLAAVTTRQAEQARTLDMLEAEVAALTRKTP